MSEITLKTLVVRFKWPILVTNLLVFLESILGVLIPLFIGLAINDLLEESFRGVIYLIVLGFHRLRLVVFEDFMILGPTPGCFGSSRLKW